MQDYQKNWNDRYGGGSFLFGKLPNEYLKNKLATLTPSELFLPGDGEGRNSVYAAQNGWNVTSSDFSEVAIKRAKTFALLESVKINFIFSDLISDELEESKFDVLGISFLHFNGKNKAIVHDKLSKSVKIGGYLILECFSESQIKLNSGGPRKKDSLYNIAELKKYYSNFDFIEIEDKKIILNEGDAHTGDAYVIRIFAQKIKV